MSEEYNLMLKELGVDVELHDELMSTTARLHEKTFQSRPSRPETMAAFDEAAHAVHGSRVQEVRAHRQAGGKSIGTFCIYVPDEIALAAEVLPIPLCGGTGWSVDYADKMFPRDICPLVRSTFGLAFSSTCPYKTLKDFAVGETTCDAKKKAWDLLGFKVMEVPQKKAEMDRDLWRAEVRAFKDAVEDLSGVTVTPEALKSSIRLVNKKRDLLGKINAYRKLDPPPLSGLDALLVSQTALAMDTGAFNAIAQALADELGARAASGASAYETPGKRVLMAGTPSPLGYAKVHDVVESSGMRIVADESCTGVRYYRNLVDETPGDLEGMLDAIADRYFTIDCACFSPNAERFENVVALARAYGVQGVVQNVLQYCHGFNVEARALENALKDADLPSLKIETDYAEEDIEQLKVRAEAFREILPDAPPACNVRAGAGQG